jgi:hypothetical protein
MLGRVILSHPANMSKNPNNLAFACSSTSGSISSVDAFETYLWPARHCRDSGLPHVERARWG